MRYQNEQEDRRRPHPYQRAQDNRREDDEREYLRWRETDRRGPGPEPRRYPPKGSGEGEERYKVIYDRRREERNDMRGNGGAHRYRGDMRPMRRDTRPRREDDVKYRRDDRRNDENSRFLNFDENNQANRRRHDGYRPREERRYESSQREERGHRSNDKDGDKRKQIVCKFFKSGSCHKGELCPFSHNLKLHACVFYHMKKSGCTKGRDCPFSHDPMTREQHEMVLDELHQYRLMHDEKVKALWIKEAEKKEEEERLKEKALLDQQQLLLDLSSPILSPVHDDMAMEVPKLQYE